MEHRREMEEEREEREGEWVGAGNSTSREVCIRLPGLSRDFHDPKPMRIGRTQRGPLHLPQNMEPQQLLHLLFQHSVAAQKAFCRAPMPNSGEVGQKGTAPQPDLDHR